MVIKGEARMVELDVSALNRNPNPVLPEKD
jgi:hypothetical protein